VITEAGDNSLEDASLAQNGNILLRKFAMCVSLYVWIAAKPLLGHNIILRQKNP
jgi:hypothetical protein